MQMLNGQKPRALVFALISPLLLASCETTTLIFDRMTGRETDRGAVELATAQRDAVCKVWLPVHYTRTTPPAVRAEIVENNAARDAFCLKADAAVADKS